MPTGPHAMTWVSSQEQICATYTCQAALNCGNEDCAVLGIQGFEISQLRPT